jgi:peptidoglycan hydrolase-like protein with peptidoglycan-binding domain
MAEAIAKLVENSTANNTLNARTVNIFFQKFPGVSGSPGIAGLEFTVTNPDGSVAQQGKTPSDGKIKIRISPGSSASLKILGSTYDVSLLGRTLFPRDELRGVQERLNILGYNAGTLRADNQKANARDAAGNMGLNDSEPSERAILNFQADNGLFTDAMVGPQTQGKINSVISSAGAE